MKTLVVLVENRSDQKTNLSRGRAGAFEQAEVEREICARQKRAISPRFMFIISGTVPLTDP